MLLKLSAVLKTFALLLAIKVFPVAADDQPLPVSPQRFFMGIYYPSIANLVTRADFQVAINVWLEEFSDPLQLTPTRAILFENMDSLKQAFVAGELDFIMAPPLLLAKHIDRSLLADGFVGTASDGTEYGMVLIARRDAGVQTLAQMRGKVLMLPKNDLLAATFMDMLSLKTYRQHFRKVFKEIHTKKRESAVVLALFFKQADVGLSNAEVFNLMIELNPQLQQSLAVLAKFPTKSPNYGYFHSDFPVHVRQAITEKVKELNQQPRPQQVLQALRMVSLVPNAVDNLTVFDSLLDEYRSLETGIKP
ncbi:MAG: PhnD/SsuA/transferrin family substrate-binding protein [Methylomonas lenta]|nr:PhnD/SsuA/transferrin family substrate-binding protein [Methylomonas lenta]